MELTSAQASKFEDWLDEKKIKDKCPICGKVGFSRTGWKKVYISEVEYITDARGQQSQYIAMVCTNCGYLIKFSADIIGLT